MYIVKQISVHRICKFLTAKCCKNRNMQTTESVKICYFITVTANVQTKNYFLSLLIITRCSASSITVSLSTSLTFDKQAVDTWLDYFSALLIYGQTWLAPLQLVLFVVQLYSNWFNYSTFTMYELTTSQNISKDSRNYWETQPWKLFYYRARYNLESIWIFLSFWSWNASFNDMPQHTDCSLTLQWPGI